MSVTRRGLLRGLLAIPIVAVIAPLLPPPHVHSWWCTCAAPQRALTSADLDRAFADLWNEPIYRPGWLDKDGNILRVKDGDVYEATFHRVLGLPDVPAGLPEIDAVIKWNGRGRFPQGATSDARR